MLDETTKIWAEVGPKYKQSEKNFKLIKAWMIKNDKKIMTTGPGAVGIEINKYST